MSLIDKYKEFPDHVLLRMYRRKLPKLVAQMRSKDRIRVLFVLHCLDKWKTEGLYRLMLQHERFEPILGLAMPLQDYPSEAVRKFAKLKDYVVAKGYDYQELCQKDDLVGIAPDIIFYIEPYNGVVNRGLEYRNATGALFCFSTYGIHTVDFGWAYSTIFYKFLWQDYYESELAARHVLKGCPSRKGSIAYTGTPFADQLLKPAESNPWKPLSNSRPPLTPPQGGGQSRPDGITPPHVGRSGGVGKRRIIYAPHYSIVDPHDKDALYIGTFLENGEFILSLAEKYADKTQWAFKPHPCLFRDLSKVWGEKRAADYYRRWSELENAQFEEGQYLDLFKHSDAMIHDCSSFICEYLYMQKPVLYLDNGNSFPQNHLGKGGLEQHYHASTHEQIEQFVKNLIAGNDPMKDSRAAFVRQNLLPPNGKTAAENIIDAILGQ